MLLRKALMGHSSHSAMTMAQPNFGAPSLHPQIEVYRHAHQETAQVRGKMAYVSPLQIGRAMGLRP